jgi:hypothetical protein
MRKIISVLLVTLMLFSVVALSASAGSCDCKNHTDTWDCCCCVYCDTTDKTFITSCSKDANDNIIGEGPCCKACTGIKKNGTGCGCDCDCCGSTAGDDGDTTGKLDIPDKAKKNFVDTFQAILGKISAAFDNFFNAIFEFLRIDDVIGKNSK